MLLSILFRTITCIKDKEKILFQRPEKIKNLWYMGISRDTTVKLIKAVILTNHNNISDKDKKVGKILFLV